MRKLIPVLTGLLFLVTAAPQAMGAEHIAGQITRIYPTSGGTVYFRLAGACKVTTYFYFNVSSDAGKAWYAMLLSAATTGQPVQISIVDPCDPAVNQPIQYVFQDY